MKKFGFTLAEVLITLGIIGVVAALTAPALTKNTGQAKIGPALAKFVNTFEVAAESLMNDQNVDKLSSAVTTDATLGAAFAKYIVMSPLGKEYSHQGPKGEGSYKVYGVPYQLKDGSVAVFDYWSSGGDGKGAYKGIMGAVTVDIDGDRTSNRMGRDVFKFLIDDSGTLVPYGSNAYKYIYPYTTNTNCSLNNYAESLNCAGAIADNGWKAEY